MVLRNHRVWCLLAVAAFVVGCSRPAAKVAGPLTLRFASFTATEEVYRRDIIPAFAEAWRDRVATRFDDLPVFARHHLIANKQASGRLPGLADVEALHKLDPRRPPR